MSNIECGDCLELMKQIPDGSIDMILTDPPYGNTYSKWDTIIDIGEMFKQYNRVIKKNGAIVLFCMEPFASRLRMSQIKTYRYDLIWVKNQVTGHLIANVQPLRQYENIAVFYKRKPVYNKQYTPCRPYVRHRAAHDKSLWREYGANTTVNTGQENPTNVLRFDVVPWNARHHVNEKPVKLLEWLIKTYTNPGDTVLDSCMGSGSTVVAAINTGRDYVGYELEPDIFDIAKSRIEEAKFLHGKDNLLFTDIEEI